MKEEIRKIIQNHQKNILPVIRKFIRGKKLLDVGCGSGINSYFFNETLGVDVTLLDYVDLREREVLKFPFFKASADKMPFENKSFDVTFVQYVLHHLSSKVSVRNVLREAKRVSRNYVIIVEEIFTDQTDEKKAIEYDIKMNKILHPSFDMEISKHFTDEELKREFDRAGLKIINEKLFDKGSEEDGFLQNRVYVLEV